MKKRLLAVACSHAVALLLGMAISDIANVSGYPYDLYDVKLKHSDAPLAQYKCLRLSLLGSNLTSFDYERQAQEDCELLAVGKLLPDGSFEGHGGARTWLGRVFESHLLVAKIPAADLASATRLSVYGSDTGPGF